MERPHKTNGPASKKKNFITMKSYKAHYINDMNFISQLSVKFVSEKEQIFVSRLNKALDSHYHDPTLSLNTLANIMAMTQRNIQRKLKTLTGYNPNKYLRMFRVEKASALLRKGHRVEDVAYHTGFKTRNYFSTCFKATTGINPKQYQLQCSKQP